MRQLKLYKHLNLSAPDEVFDYMIENLKPSNMLWTYFVNWEKVKNNTGLIEVPLNILNYMIGKDNFDDELRNLIADNPSVIPVLPSLAVRDGKNTKKFKILVDFENRILKYEDIDFTKTNPTPEDIEKYLMFVKKTGIQDLIQSKTIKNLVDYMFGVEAGLDSNARKNRGGHSMEHITEAYVADLCERKGFKYLAQANAAKILSEFGVNVPVDKSSRSYDFVIKTDINLYIFETNFYQGGGSKLKSTAGEYRNLFNVLDGKFPFIWVTDGMGWHTTKRPLGETFYQNDYVFTLRLLEDGVLDEVIV